MKSKIINTSIKRFLWIYKCFLFISIKKIIWWRPNPIANLIKEIINMRNFNSITLASEELSNPRKILHNLQQNFWKTSKKVDEVIKNAANNRQNINIKNEIINNTINEENTFVMNGNSVMLMNRINLNNIYLEESINEMKRGVKMQK